MTYLAALLLTAISPVSTDPFARARADIDAFCASKSDDCVTTQRRQMAKFVMMMAGFPGDKNDAATCMQSGKTGKHVDWVVAASCLRTKVEGRRLGD